MAKRFIQTELFRNPWLRVAKPLHKVLWVALITECDHAGIWIVDWQMMSLLCGAEIDESEARDFLDGRFVEIDSGRRWFFPDFIRYQYPNGVIGDNFNMKSIRAIFLKYGINPENLTISNPYIRVQQGLDKGCQTLKDKDKEIEEDKEIDRGVQGGNREPRKSFAHHVENFISAYGGIKGGNRRAIELAYIDAVNTLNSEGHSDAAAHELLAIQAARDREYCKQASQTRNNTQNWLAKRLWEKDYDQELKMYLETSQKTGGNGNGHGKQESPTLAVIRHNRRSGL